MQARAASLDPYGWELPTARMLIRPLIEDDIAAIDAYRAGMPFVTQRSLAEHRALYAHQIGVEPGGSGWHSFVCVHGSDGIVGDIGVNFGGPGPEQAELGFTFDRRWQGRGLAYEGVGRMIGHLFNVVGLHRLVAVTDRRNTRSRSLLESLRFRLEGKTVQSRFEAGHWIDERWYARLASE